MSFANNILAAADIIVVEGDSLSTPSQWAEMVGTAMPNTTIINQSTGGQTIAQMVTDYPAQVAPYFSRSRGTNLAILRGGTNDITNGESAATVLARIASWVALADATGIPVLVCTITPVRPSNWDAPRQAVWATANTGIRSTYAGRLIDLAAEPGFQTAADADNAVLFPDGTHISATGNQILTDNRFLPAIAAFPFPAPRLGTLAAQDALSFGPVRVVDANHAIKLHASPAFTNTLLQFVDGGAAFLSGIGHTVDGAAWWMLGSGSTVTFRNSNDGTACFRATAAGIYGADVRVGLSTGELMAGVGGCITTDTTQTGNVGTGEDTLQTYSLAANSLFVNGNTISFTYAGTVANNVNAKRIRLRWGATLIFDSGALPTSAAFDWTISGEVIRTGAATQKCTVRFITNNATAVATCDYTTAAETLSGAVILLLTGEAVDNNDIVKEIFKLRFER